MKSKLWLGLLATLAAGYWLNRLGRRWGATEAEMRATLPGDEMIARPAIQTTHAITIHAPPAAVWPWLVQMGYGRAGWYTNAWWYRLVDRYLWRVDMARADRILPQFQRLAPGDVIPDGPQGSAYWTVVGLESGRLLALYSITHGTVFLPRALRENKRLGIHVEVGWTFVLREPAPGQTRLILRTRASGGPPLYLALVVPLLPPADLFVATLLLRTVKRNVERVAARQPLAPEAAQPAQVAPPA